MSLYKHTFGPGSPEELLALTAKPINLETPIAIGGSCSVESVEQMNHVFDEIGDHITHMRGGVFRQGTYPGSQGSWVGEQWPSDATESPGWRMDLLKAYHEKSQDIGKANVVEVLDLRDLEVVYDYAEVFQVGMRQAQHYALLEELGRQSKPVFLKRGTWMKLDELLGAVEYLFKGGNMDVAIIERGSVSFMDHCRWDLSISLIAKLKQLTSIPVIVDASHGTGDRSIVKPMTLAGIAAGADGFLVETHFDPDGSLSDAEQAVSLDAFIDIAQSVSRLRGLFA